MINPILSLTESQKRALSEILAKLTTVMESGNVCQFRDSTGIHAISLYILLTKLQSIQTTLDYLSECDKIKKTYA